MQQNQCSINNQCRLDEVQMHCHGFEPAKNTQTTLDIAGHATDGSKLFPATAPAAQDQRNCVLHAQATGWSGLETDLCRGQHAADRVETLAKRNKTRGFPRKKHTPNAPFNATSGYFIMCVFVVEASEPSPTIHFQVACFQGLDRSII